MLYKILQDFNKNYYFYIDKGNLGVYTIIS